MGDDRLLVIRDDRLQTEKIALENKWGSNKAIVNEVCTFRIDLPCYPRLWSEPLFMEVELLIMVDKECRRSKRYEIVDDAYAVIEKQTLRINEPLNCKPTIY